MRRDTRLAREAERRLWLDSIAQIAQERQKKMKGYNELVVCGRPKKILNWAISLLSPRAPFRFAEGVSFTLRNSGKQDLEAVAIFLPSADHEYHQAHARAEEQGILFVAAEVPGRQS